jgi:hypothetical protein
MRLCIALCTVATLGLCLVSRADEPARKESATAPPYRTLKLPADEVTAWIRAAGGNYVRVPAAEFERAAAAAKKLPADFSQADETHLVDAEFRARLAADDTLLGQARLNIKHFADAPSLLPLSPCGMAIREREGSGGGREVARWLGSSPRRAILGTCEGLGTCVWVERSGELEFDWSLRGRRRNDGAIAYSLALPACPVRSLHLDLPRGLFPWIDRGTVEAEASTSDERRSWRLRLPGGADAPVLTLVRDTAVTPAADVTVKQALAYRLWLHGMDVHAELNLDVREAPLRQLEMMLEPGVELLAVRYRGDQRISWTVKQQQATERTAVRERARTVVLHFPTPLTGPRHVLTFEATAPLELGQPATLPMLRCSGTAWQEGVAKVWLEQSLTLDSLVTRKCRQSSRLSVEPFERFVGRQLEVQFFAAEGAVALVAGRAPERFEVASGTSVVVAESDLHAQTIAVFRGVEGQTFTLTADVGPQWSIDAVEAEPASALEGWELVPAKPPAQSLQLRLRTPLAAGDEVRLRISGKRFDTPGSAAVPRSGVLRQEEIEMLRFRESAWRRRLVEVEASAPAQLRPLRLEDAQRLDPAKLAVEERDLFEDPPTGMLFDAGVLGSRFELQLTRRTESFRAELLSEVLVTADKLRESYALRGIPGDAPVAELDVRFSVARAAAPQWTLAGEDAAGITADRRDAADGEVWRIRFARPRASPFELRAVRTTPCLERLPVSLPLLPQAHRQDGTLRVSAAPGVNFQVEHHNLAPQPIDAASAPSGLRSVLQFDPLRDAAPGGNVPAVSIVRSPSALPTSPVIAWEMSLESWYEPSGRSRHLASLDVEITDRDALTMQLPAEAEHIEVRVMDKLVLRRARGSEPLPVPLSGRGREARVKLRIAYQLTAAPWRGSCLVDAPFPQLGFPVLARHWTVRVPAGYEALAQDGLGRLVQPTAGRSWPTRLLGPLARNDEQPPFNPLSLADWKSQLGLSEAQTALAAPAPMAESNEREDTPPAGETPEWRVFRFVGPAEAAARVKIADRSSLEALGWALLPLAAVVMWCFGSRSFRGTFAAAAVLVAASLIVPEALVPLTSCALVGLYAGMLMLLLWPPRRKEAATGNPRNAGAALVGRAGLAVLAVGVAGGLTSILRAQPPNAKDDLPIVVIPQENGKLAPAQAVYHVPRPLWDALRQQASLAARRSKGWQLERARYTSKVLPPALAGEPYQVEIISSYNLRTWVAAQAVRLDFVSPQPKPLPADAILDGRVAPLQWEENGRVATLTVEEPGSHVLEVQFRRNGQFDGLAWRMEQHVPAVAQADISVALPADQAISLELPSALGVVTAAENGRVVHGELGPADRITLSWRDKSLTASAPLLEVDELLWLRVKPGSVSLQAKWVCDAVRGSVRRLRLAVDPALHLRGAVRASEPGAVSLERDAAAQAANPSGPEMYGLLLDRPRTGPFTLEAEFLLSDTLGIGALRLPHLALQGAPATRRRLAVSVDPELEDEEWPGNLPRGAIGEFLEKWRGTGDKPPLAPNIVRLLSGETSQWSLTVRPREVRRTVQQSLRASLSPGRADVAFSADVTISGGACFQHVLRVPSSLVLDHVAVTEGAQRRELRWSMQPAGAFAQVSVFLQDKAGTAQHIELAGHLPLPPAGTWTPPSIQIQDAEVQASTLRVYRRAGVRVTASKPAMPPKKDKSDAPLIERGLGRLVAQFNLLEQGAAATLQLQPNRPRIVAPLFVTAAGREGDPWKLDLVYDLQVADGILDSVTFDVPATLPGPAQWHPPGQVELQSMPGQTRGTWRYVPLAPLQGSQRIRLSVALPKSAGGGLEVPDIRPLESLSVFRVLSLPTAAGGTWDMEGLVRLGGVNEIPDAAVRARLQGKDGPNRLPSDIGPDAYRLTDGDHFSARWRPADVAQQGRITRAAVQVRVDGAGEFVSTARFELEPGGARQCEVVLPPDVQLLRASIDGMPALGTQQNGGRVVLDLHSRRQPQPIEIIFSGPVERSGTPSQAASGLPGRYRWTAPQFVGISSVPVQWEVQPPEGFRAATQEAGESLMVEFIALDRPAPGWPGWLVAASALGGVLILRRMTRDEPPLTPSAGDGVPARPAAAGQWLARYGHWPPYAYWLGVVAGLAWWLWLWPSVLGWLIIAGSLLASFRSGLPWR